jgi:hypothetical protein
VSRLRGYSFSGAKIGKFGSKLVSDLSPARLRSYMSVSESLKGGTIFNFLTINDIPMTSGQRGIERSVTFTVWSMSRKAIAIGKVDFS